jgi:hypothetical protein
MRKFNFMIEIGRGDTFQINIGGSVNIGVIKDENGLGTNS